MSETSSKPEPLRPKTKQEYPSSRPSKVPRVISANEAARRNLNLKRNSPSDITLPIHGDRHAVDGNVFQASAAHRGSSNASNRSESSQWSSHSATIDTKKDFVDLTLEGADLDETDDTDKDDEDEEIFAPSISKRRKLSSGETTVGSNPSITRSLVEVLIPTKHGLDLLYSQQRELFLSNLSQLCGPPVTFSNKLDDTSPPTNFRFIDQYVLGPGVEQVPVEYQIGCKCKAIFGPETGCVYLNCDCLEYSAIDENGKRQFPYAASAQKLGCLRNFYLESRNMIYECNHLCQCGPGCKNKVVQHGRQLPLEIFKTERRGFGLRCPVHIQKGQFIDTYRGEVITDAEADLREKNSTGKNSYLYSLDKFQKEDDDDEGYPIEELFVVDGEMMGGPSRFMNHSCDPNCRQFTVSLLKFDQKVYQLAFFALRTIPAGEELTFDYHDDDNLEPVSDEKAANQEKETGKKPVRCLCGSRDCRRYLWLS